MGGVYWGVNLGEGRGGWINEFDAFEGDKEKESGESDRRREFWERVRWEQENRGAGGSGSPFFWGGGLPLVPLVQLRVNVLSGERSH